MAHIRGVILDLDGTLIDSMSIWHEIDIAFFAENGLELPDGISEQVAKMSIDEWASFFVKHYVPPSRRRRSLHASRRWRQNTTATGSR